MAIRNNGKKWVTKYQLNTALASVPPPAVRIKKATSFISQDFIDNDVLVYTGGTYQNFYLPLLADSIGKRIRFIAYNSGSYIYVNTSDSGKYINSSAGVNTETSKQITGWRAATFLNNNGEEWLIEDYTPTVNF